MDCVDYAYFRMCQIIGLTASPVSKNTDAASAAALEALALSLKANYVVLDESSSMLAVRVRAVATLYLKSLHNDKVRTMRRLLERLSHAWHNLRMQEVLPEVTEEVVEVTVTVEDTRFAKIIGKFVLDAIELLEPQLPGAGKQGGVQRAQRCWDSCHCCESGA
jgi:hypothetical protein